MEETIALRHGYRLAVTHKAACSRGGFCRKVDEWIDQRIAATPFRQTYDLP
jgi:hypothetical protein